MKKIISIISVLVAAAGLTACRENRFSAGNIADNSNVSQSTTSSQSSMTSQSIMSSQSSTASQSTASSNSSTCSYDNPLFIGNDLKGEELIAKFGWPYDAAIETEGMTAQKEILKDSVFDFEDIPLSEISNEFRWIVKCDYGYLAITPDDGGEYEFMKYRAGDMIGDFTVKEIETDFRKLDSFDNYFLGVWATFKGEITLTGELSIPQWNQHANDLIFSPDEESRKKLPVVNFEPKLDPPDRVVETPYPPKVENLHIFLGETTDYSEMDFKNIPTDGTCVKVKIKIKDYGYRACCGSPFIGSAKIVDGGFEIL